MKKLEVLMRILQVNLGLLQEENFKNAAKFNDFEKRIASNYAEIRDLKANKDKEPEKVPTTATPLHRVPDGYYSQCVPGFKPCVSDAQCPKGNLCYFNGAGNPAICCNIHRKQ